MASADDPNTAVKCRTQTTCRIRDVAPDTAKQASKNPGTSGAYADRLPPGQVGAALIGLATGPYRAREFGWEQETARLLDMAVGLLEEM